MFGKLVATADLARTLQEGLLMAGKGEVLNQTFAKTVRHSISKGTSIYETFLKGAKEPNIVVDIAGSNAANRTLGFRFMDGESQVLTRGSLDIAESRIGYDLCYVNPSSTSETIACSGFYNPELPLTQVDRAMFGWDRPNWVADTKLPGFGCRLEVSADAARHGLTTLKGLGSTAREITASALSGKSLPKDAMEQVERTLRG